MANEIIQVERDKRVAVITLNRPERLNAINREAMHLISLEMKTLESDENVAVVILRGVGRAFSAGMDLKDDAVADVSGKDAWREVLSKDLEFLTRFWNFPKPTIAVVHGFCMAAACDLAIGCDITIAEEDAYFGKPELKFGSVITSMIMPWLTGPKIAKELLLSADDRISAERALAVGLVNHVVPSGTGLKFASDMAHRMACLDDDALQLTKSAINKSIEIMGLQHALAVNLDLAVEIEAMETPSRARFKEIVRTEGLQAALVWREGRFSAKSDKKS